MRVVYAICAVLCILLLCGAEGVVEQSFLCGAAVLMVGLIGFILFTCLALTAKKKSARPKG